MAHFVAGGNLGMTAMSHPDFRPNTDDRNMVEFGFARSVGAATAFDMASLREWARRNAANRPRLVGDDVDWDLVEDRRFSMLTASGVNPRPPSQPSREQRS